MEYVAADGSRQRPIMIHRAIFGSLERFFGILIENYAGDFPLWLAPTQVRVLVVSDRFRDYAESIVQSLKQQNIRAEVDRSQRGAFRQTNSQLRTRENPGYSGDWSAGVRSSIFKCAIALKGRHGNHDATPVD